MPIAAPTRDQAPNRSGPSQDSSTGNNRSPTANGRSPANELSQRERVRVRTARSLMADRSDGDAVGFYLVEHGVQQRQQDGLDRLLVGGVARQQGDLGTELEHVPHACLGFRMQGLSTVQRD